MRYPDRGAPPRAEADTRHMGHVGADTLLETHVQVLDHAVSRATREVNLGRP